MNIQWNIVTWYSKLIAAILFVLVVPAWTFYLGMRYEEAKVTPVLASSEIVPLRKSEKALVSTQSASSTPATTTTVVTTPKQTIVATPTVAPKGISLSYIYPKNTSFTIKDYPEATFTVKSVTKATGPIQNESGCSSPASNTFLKNLYFGNSGICMSLSTIDDQPLALVAVDINVSNDGASTLSGNLIQLLYTVKVNGKEVTRLAQTYLPFDSYSVGPSSSRVVRVGFMIPANQNDFSLTYGYVGVKPSDGENFFGAGQGGYSLNFLTKSFVSIEG